jgi:tetratricopeptide (TPR) repeat protein
MIDRFKRLPGTTLILICSLLAFGCSTNPRAKLQKFLEQGNREFQQGKYPEAMIFYGRALQIDPHSAETHYKLAQTHLKMSSWASAFQELSRTVDLDPQNWAAQLDLGRLQLAGGRAKEAKERAQLILQSNPQNADAEMLLSDADVALGNMKDALQEANSAIAMVPGRSDLYLNLGRVQIRQHDLAGAEQSFKKAQSIDPASVLPVLTLGRFYQQNKRWAEAESEFKAAIQIAPKDVAPRAALAALYFNQGQESQAEKVLTDAKEQLASDPNAYRLLGDSYLGRRQYEKALPEFGALQAKYPNDLAVRKTYVQLLILGNRVEEANKLNQEILKKSPQDPESLVLKGQIEIRQNQTDQAITTLQQATKNAPDNALAHYHLGIAFRQKGSTQQAESEWREAVRLRPGLSEAWVALGTNATARSDWRSLTDISDQLRKSSPNSIEAYLFHATARLNQGDAAGAEADLNHLLQLVPDQPMPYVKLGQLRLSQKRYNEAEVYFRQAMSRDSNSLDAVKGVVAVDLAKNKAPDAQKFIQGQIDRNPNSPGLYLLQGQIQLQAKQVQMAEPAFARAVELDPNSVSALVLLAQTQSLLGKRELAIASYQKAIALSPQDSRLYADLGNLYERSGDWQNARDNYQKALAIQPENALAANGLAYILLEHNGDVNVALTLAQTARKGFPNLPNTADTLGWAYYHTRAYSAALPLFESAVKSQPTSQTYHYHLGLTYEKLQDHARAKAELEKAISIDPKSALAEEARRAISEIATS